MDQPTKEVLVAVASRDESACAELIRSVEPVAKAALLGWQFDSEDDREDVLQQVRSEIIDHVAEYDPARGQFVGWVYGIVRNIANSHIRSRDRRPETPFSQLSDDYDPPDGTQRVDAEGLPPSSLVEAYRAVYQQLPLDERVVVDHIIAHEAGAVTHEDLAILLGKSPAAAKQKVYRTKLKLKRLIEEQLELTKDVTLQPRKDNGDTKLTITRLVSEKERVIDE